MDHPRYSRLGRRWRRTKGFRPGCYRFFVFRRRVRFISFFGFLTRWLELLKNSFSRRDGRRCGRSSSRRGLVAKEQQGGRAEMAILPGLRSCGRSNSFYAEAIADCLEFIKRTSVSREDESIARG